MYKKILVPLDGSELAEMVIPRSVSLANQLEADITYLMVWHGSEQKHGGLYRKYIKDIADDVRKQLDTGNSRVSGETVEGYPAEEILRYSEKNATDIIIMATHGYSGVRRWALGSTADKILRKSRTPVLLIRVGVEPDLDCDDAAGKEIVVLLDGSELAESVLTHVESIIRGQETGASQIVLIRVCEPSLMPSYYPPNVPMMPDDYVKSATKELKSAATKYLSEVEERLKPKGLNVRSELLTGNPAEEIIKYTQNHPCHLVVMSTHGRSGITRWVYGSVAEKVISRASSPILLVRPGNTCDPDAD